MVDQVQAGTLPKRLENLAPEIRRPAMTSFYGIAGRVLCVEASHARAGRAVASFLRDFYVERLSTAAEHLFSYTIRVYLDQEPPSIPETLATFEVAFGTCYLSKDGYYLAVEGSVIRVGDRNDQTMDVWFGSSKSARSAVALSNVLAYVLDAALRRCGLFQLHGSGVIAPGCNGGTLIVGESGSGKSTLATLLATSGWSYLTDDALLLSAENDHVRARGMRTFFAASERTLSACGLSEHSAAVGLPLVSDPSKRRLEPAIAFPGQALEYCVPDLLLFSSIGDEEHSTLQGLSQSEAMTQLIRSNPWASYDGVSARGHLRVLNELAKQCRSFSIRAGQDILRRPSRAEELLNRLVTN